jgi:CheY-like chemotaxis protein
MPCPTRVGVPLPPPARKVAMPTMHSRSNTVPEKIRAPQQWARVADAENATVVAGEPGDEARARILVVDGDYDSRVVFGTYLEHVGFGVRAAPSPRDALRLARVHVPDAIVCELLLPPLDGRHFVEWLRTDPVARWIPIIGVTAWAFPLPDALGARCTRVLRKPCPLPVLLETLCSVGVRPNTRAVQLRIVNGQEKQYP